MSLTYLRHSTYGFAAGGAPYLDGPGLQGMLATNPGIASSTEDQRNARSLAEASLGAHTACDMGYLGLKMEFW